METLSTLTENKLTYLEYSKALSTNEIHVLINNYPIVYYKEFKTQNFYNWIITAHNHIDLVNKI